MSCRGRNVMVDELERNFGKFVGIQDEYVSDDSFTSDDEEYEGIEPYGPESGKRVSNCLSPSNHEEEEDNEPETGLPLLFTSKEPPLPLVSASAMKGSREKQGIASACRKLSVTWAPDVHDPVPDSVSYTAKSKQKKSREDTHKEEENNNKYYKRKNGKKQQKGNSLRGSGIGSKYDKKKFGKYGGRPDKYRTFDDW